MGEILKFKKRAHKKSTLCLNGFHKWKIVTAKKFDVKQGRLVTVVRCERCGKERNELH